MSDGRPSYEELEQRLARAEAALEALRRGEVDRVIGPEGPLAVRLQSLVEENERLARLWQTTFDGLDDAVWVEDRDGRIVRANQAAGRLFGKSPEELVGQLCWEAVHGTGGPVPHCPMLRARQSLRRETMEMSIGVRWFEVTANPLLDEQARFEGVVHVVSETTPRKRAEEALQLSEERLRLAMTVANDGLWDWDLATDDVYFDPRYYLMAGYQVDEFPHRLQEFQRRVHPDDLPRVMAEAERHLAGRTDRFEVEFRFRRKDGTYLWVLGKGQITARDPGGKPLRFVGTHSDITDRKLAEEKLRQSEETYRNLFQNAQVGLFRTRIEDGKILESNERLARMFGYGSREELIARFATKKSYVDPGTRERMLERLRRDGSIENFEARLYRKDRSIFWARYSARIYPECGWIEGVVEDITQRRETEKALRESEARFRRLAENAQDLIYRYEFVPQRRFAYVSPAATAITGFTPEEHYADPDLGFKLIHPDDRHLLEGVARGGVPFDRPLLLRWFHKDGSIVWTEQRNVPVYDEQGRLVAIEGIVRDVSARKQAEEELWRLRELYESIVQDVTEGLILTDAEGRITFANRALAGMLGHAEEELVGRSWLTFVAPEHQAAAREAEVRRAAGESHRYELELERRDGSRVAVLLGGRPRFDSVTGRFAGTLAVVTDLTERKRAEEERAKLQEQLLQAQKLESIGRLAGGVAHDFNNMLNVIMGYADLMLYQLHKDDPMRRKAEEILKAARRSAALTRQLLAFSRKQTLQPQVLDLNDHLRNLEKMLRRLIGEDIELSFVLADGLPPVLFDPGQLDQVVINLAVNARDAMPEGGRLLIETTLARRDEDYAATHPGMEAGSYVLLAITDTGCGMDHQTLARVFEPFFTTKERGKGTGLGLSTVYGIVKQSHGHIWAYSEPGRGTTFKIYLPPTEAQPQVPAAATASPAPSGGEHILVVEDDDSLRHLTKGLLERLGYRVSVAANGGEAVLLVEEQGLRPDLVLTDVVMPSMNGKELVDRLRLRHPHLKALFMSGYTDNAIVHHGVLDPGNPFIQKPFTIEELAAKVRAVLAGGGP
ncbi:MAG TPA: PAS domain S-box protein [Thermoanaerobaculaceae bacterium]|nr:PAS domain S-box protein [Thermoanaerobaculaceae bacterium]HRS15952.1 PAS domain S-box protein [Thermoanaerobaculaceae bacterium]